MDAYYFLSEVVSSNVYGDELLSPERTPVATDDIASWLRRELLRREWSQADFARRVHASTGNVSNWLSGKRRPMPESCDRIADVMFVDRDFVLALAGHRPLDEPVDADDPGTRIAALVPRVRWTPDRAFGIERLFTGWIEFDRDDPDGG